MLHKLDMSHSERYRRQIDLPEIGEVGQKRIINSSVLILGAGGLGSPLAYYLCAGGVGRIGILDSDTVDLSNLQRQILHGEADTGTPKVDSGAGKLKEINSECVVDAYHCRLTPENASGIFASYDFIADAFDNFDSKLLAADTAWKLKKPYSYAGINAFEGQTMTIMPGKRPCLRCLFRRQPKDSKPVGPFGAIAGIIGSIQSAEILKTLAGIQPALQGELLFFDALHMNSRKIKIKPASDCNFCR